MIAERRQLGTRALTVGALGVVWLVLAGGRVDSILVGVPTVAVAAWMVFRMREAGQGRLRLAGFLGFVPYFLWQVLVSGLDVAIRAVRGPSAIEPGLVGYALSIRAPAGRRFMAHAVSMLPGTISTALTDDRLRVHALDVRCDTRAGLRRLERRVAKVFGEPGPAGGATGEE